MYKHGTNTRLRANHSLNRNRSRQVRDRSLAES